MTIKGGNTMERNKEYISVRQLTVMVILYIVGSAVLYIPFILASASKQDAWIAAIVGNLLSLGLMWGYVKFSKVYPEKDFIQYCELAFGKWGGKAVGIIFLSFPFFLCSILLWNIGDFIITQILPETPIEVIFILFMLIVIYGVRLGIEPLCRAGEIFIPWVLGQVILVVFLLVPVIEIKNATPIFEGGFRSIFAGAYAIVGFPFLELVVFLMVFHHLDKKDNLKKALFIGTSIGGFILTIITLYCILILGPELTSRNAYPTYAIGKKINIGNFLQRIEVIVAVIWFLSIYFKLAINFYAVCIGLSKIFSLRDYRLLTLPLGMLNITLTPIMIPSTVFLLEFTKYTSTPYKSTFAILLPLIIYLVLKIKKSKSTLTDSTKNQASQ